MRTANEILEGLSDVFNLDPQTLEQLSQAGPRYFQEARAELIRALRDYEEDQRVPVCLHCGSPRVDWIEATATYRCQDCGAVEERAGEGRRAA